ncbi:MAG: peptidoglycan-binding protein [Methyloprofundus sp.]|nr:peptidoglycan-binding protein [Methyloprofundus sp.]
MNNQDQNANSKKSHQFNSLKTRKKILLFLQEHFVITGILTFLYSGFVFSVILLIPGELYAAKSNTSTNTIRNVQLLLSLKGYDLGYGDSKGIDGKLGSITKDAIKDYQKKNNLTPNGAVDKFLNDRLYKDIKSKSLLPSNTQKTDRDTAINPPSKELNKIKDDLKSTNASLISLTDDMSNHFITNYRDLVAVVGVSLGIVAGLLAGLLAWGIPKLQRN